MMEFRLRGTERLPSTIRAIKDNVCMIVASRDPKLSISEAVSNMPMMYSLQKLGKGTSFLLSSRHVVTALHVVHEATEIVGYLPSGKQR